MNLTQLLKKATPHTNSNSVTRSQKEYGLLKSSRKQSRSIKSDPSSDGSEPCFETSIHLSMAMAPLEPKVKRGPGLAQKPTITTQRSTPFSNTYYSRHKPILPRKPSVSPASSTVKEKLAKSVNKLTTRSLPKLPQLSRLTLSTVKSEQTK